MPAESSASSLTLRQLCLYTLLGTLCFVLKLVMAPLPNIEPVTLFILVLGRVCGWPGLVAVGVYVALEMIVWGLGFWVLAYCYVWPLWFCLAHTFRRVDSSLFWAALAATFGFFFGALCALPMLVMGGISAAFAWWQAGVIFDLVHGLANFMVVLALEAPLYRLVFRLWNSWSK